MIGFTRVFRRAVAKCGNVCATRTIGPGCRCAPSGLQTAVWQL